MSNPQKQIRDLIEQLERDHGIVTAFRVNRHLVAALDELARKPLTPKQGKDQVRGSATHLGIPPPVGCAHSVEAIVSEPE